MIVNTTPRDLGLLKFLFRGKISTAEQLHRHIFKGTNKSVVYRRLSKLYQYKLIEKNAFVKDNFMTAYYSISKMGFKYIKKHLEFEAIKFHKSDSATHDIVLNEIRSVLNSKKEVSRLYSENELNCYNNFKEDKKIRPFIDLKSDGVLELDKNNLKMLFAIEYDASKKSSKRYSLKVSDYYQYKNTPGIFYIAEPSILNRIKSVEMSVCKRHSGKFKFFYATLDDIINRKEKLYFVNQDRHKIAIS